MGQSSQVVVTALAALIPTVLTIDASPTSGHVAFTVAVSGVLTDNVGNPLSGKTIQLYSAYEGGPFLPMFTDITDVNGVYGWDLLISDVGSYAFYTEFAGDSVYEGCGETVGVLADGVVAFPWWLMVVAPVGLVVAWWLSRKKGK